jgi:hypothetical protein
MKMSYPDESQFGTCDEEAFLAQLVYSRDFPPATNPEPWLAPDIG